MSAKHVGDIVSGVIAFSGYFFGMDDSDFRPLVLFIFIIAIFILAVAGSCIVEYLIENRKHGHKRWNGNGIGQ